MNTPDSPGSPQIADLAATSPVPHEALTYSVAEVAVALGVSVPTIYRLIGRRVLRPLNCLRHKRIPKRQVEALVNRLGTED